jgi:hypothetical protein
MDKKTELKIVMAIALFIVATVFWLSTVKGNNHTMTDFYQAIAEVESNNNDQAHGSVGEIGRYQITEAYWQDAVEFTGIGGEFHSCFLKGYSELIMEAYFRRYAYTAFKAGDYYALARIHHGGWNGMNREHTKAYADRVVALMEAK